MTFLVGCFEFVGSMDLDPNRVLDTLLDTFELGLEEAWKDLVQARSSVSSFCAADNEDLVHEKGRSFRSCCYLRKSMSCLSFFSCLFSDCFLYFRTSMLMCWYGSMKLFCFFCFYISPSLPLFFVS